VQSNSVDGITKHISISFQLFACHILFLWVFIDRLEGRSNIRANLWRVPKLVLHCPLSCDFPSTKPPLPFLCSGNWC
jgi:hypothetical protein